MGKLLHAGGEPLHDLGKCEVDLVIDTLTVKKEVIIADIRDAVLLGMDILKGNNGKPADIMLSQGKIVLDGVEINCQHYTDSKTRKVTSADHYVIQGNTEQVIDAYVERCEMDDSRSFSDILIEGSVSFREKSW
jgi:hypothetical protein